jgi:hypothetical protein
MLFDLRGRGRRTTVRIIYLGLALLIGVGLIGFGIGGGFGSSGFLNAAGQNEGSNPSYSGQIKKYEKQIKLQPSNVAAWEGLLKVELNEAGGEGYTSSSGLTSRGRQLFSHIAQSWSSYVALNPPHPNVTLAQNMLRIFGEEGLNKPAEAVQVLQIIVASKPTNAPYYAQLAKYAYQAHNTRAGDLAAAKAITLVPALQRPRLKTELAALKANPTGGETLTGSTNGKTFTVKPNGQGGYSGVVPSTTPTPSSTTKKK